MDRAQQLRNIARTCYAIAQASSGWSAENLRTLAREYEARAAALEAQRTGGADGRLALSGTAGLA